MRGEGLQRTAWGVHVHVHVHVHVPHTRTDRELQTAAPRMLARERSEPSRTHKAEATRGAVFVHDPQSRGNGAGQAERSV